MSLLQVELADYLSKEKLIPEEHLQRLRSLSPLEFSLGVQTHLGQYRGRECEAILPLLAQLKSEKVLESAPVLRRDQVKRLLEFLIYLLR